MRSHHDAWTGRGLLALVRAGCLAACVSGCTSSAQEADCPDPAAAVEELFTRRCGTAACHEGAAPAAGLDLVSAAPELRLVSVPSAECGGQTLVVAGDPEASYLFEKLTASAPACGARMPIGLPLTEGEVVCVREWIEAAAPRDPPPDGGVSCADGLEECAGRCVDTSGDPRNCGGCGVACAVACSGGECVDACPPQTEDCAGTCADLDSDPAHCGDCARACDPGQLCVNAACSCGAPVSFSGQVQPIFTAGCASNACHGGQMPRAELDLRTGRAHAELVGVASAQCAGRTLVVPGDVDASYLVNKLTGQGMCVGSRMPKGAAPLSAQEMDAIRAWICSGALSD